MRIVTSVTRLILTAAVLVFGLGVLSGAEVRADDKPVMTKFKTVDLNTASAEELAAIEALGPEKAQSIVDFRNENGPFLAVEDLLRVAGMDEALIAKIRSRVTVENALPEGTDHKETNEHPKATNEHPKADK